jgi:hypothetical protein
MQITLDLPDELVSRLSSLEDKLPQIWELGLRELNASSQRGFTGAAEVLSIASLPKNTVVQPKLITHLLVLTQASSFD